MANTQTTVPIFVAAQVLEANQLNQSAATGVPVFATTVTRDAGFGGAGEKPLAEGQLCYLESTNVVQYYDGAAWATVGPAAPAAAGALTYISGGSLSTTSTTFTNAFSATYDNYLVTVNALNCSAGFPVVLLTLGAATANYAYSYNAANQFANFAFQAGSAAAASIELVQLQNTTSQSLTMRFLSPFLADRTTIFSEGLAYTASQWAQTAGAHNVATSFTSFTLASSTAATLSGTVRIYGFANS